MRHVGSKLCHAAFMGQVDVLQKFKATGCDMSATDVEMLNTPLHVAAAEGKLHCVEVWALSNMMNVLSLMFCVLFNSCCIIHRVHHTASRALVLVFDLLSRLTVVSVPCASWCKPLRCQPRRRDAAAIGPAMWSRELREHD